MSFWVVSDSGSDLSKEYVDNQQKYIQVPITYEMDGVIHVPKGSNEESKAFYAALREGKITTTAQINVHTWIKTFEPLVEKGEKVLCLPLSGGLSGTFEAAISAKKELDHKFPDNHLVVLDSKAASLGQGLLVHYVLRKRSEGASFEETIQWVKENILHISHWFTVDDLQFLRRGGRVSTASAYLGSILKIKPVLHVDDSGKLILMEKVQGRKKALNMLFSKVKNSEIDTSSQTIFISHGDVPKDVRWLKNKLEKELGIKDIMIGDIGPVVGSHSGPGTVAIFFLDAKR